MPEAKQCVTHQPPAGKSFRMGKLQRRLLWAGGLLLLFVLYVTGISHNPPGFYVDESALCYNAYLISQTGHGEFGGRFPLFFQIYTGGFTQYSNPTQIYLLALVFRIFGPGILIARLLAAVSVFAASLLLGALAGRLSGRRAIGVIVGATALLTPWLFEVSRLVLETFFYPMAVVLFLWAVYRAQTKQAWTWGDCVLVALTLALLTYTYTIGRLLAPLLAFGLLCFATSKQRLFSIGKTWLLYGVTLFPLIIFNLRNPGLTTRFYLLSYIKPDSTWSEIFFKFIARFLEDISPARMLFKGDLNQRHHMPDALGSFYFATFALAMFGILVVLLRYRRSSWWWFAVYGLLASVVPGALTVDAFHTLRMIAYPIFLLLLTVPALKWMLKTPAGKTDEGALVTPPEKAKNKTAVPAWLTLRHGLLAVFLTVTLAEAFYFHRQYQLEGGKRGYIFDAAYKQVYDDAVTQPSRPIYLVDNYWGPAYIHSFWYATLEGRSLTEFIHQPYGVRPPAGVVVLSTERACTDCEMLSRNGDYILYRTIK